MCPELLTRGTFGSFLLVCAGIASAQGHELARFLAAGGKPEDSFGWAVSISADRILVGAKGDDDQGTRAGAAYLFERRPNGTWAEVTKLLASDGAQFADFGSSVSLSGDRALVGAPGDDRQGANSGSAYLFERQPSGAWTARRWSSGTSA